MITKNETTVIIHLIMINKNEGFGMERMVRVAVPEEPPGRPLLRALLLQGIINNY